MKLYDSKRSFFKHIVGAISVAVMIISIIFILIASIEGLVLCFNIKFWHLLSTILITMCIFAVPIMAFFILKWSHK